MDNKFDLEIVTPHGIFLHYQVGYLSLPTYSGYIGIAPSHRPIIASIKQGVLKTFTSHFNFEKIGKIDQSVFVARGFVDFCEGKCSVVVEEATDVTRFNEKEINQHIAKLREKIKQERVAEMKAKVKEDLIIEQAKKSIIKDLSKGNISSH